MYNISLESHVNLHSRASLIVGIPILFCLSESWMNNAWMINSGKNHFVFVGLIAAMMFTAAFAWSSENDRFIQGYATAILEREFHVRPVSIKVKGGIIYLSEDGIKGLDRGRIMEELSSIDGVRRVEIGDSDVMEKEDIAVSDELQEMELSSDEVNDKEDATYKSGKLFAPLMADPRWPSFSTAYHYYPDDNMLKDVFAASVGDGFSLYTGSVPLRIGGKWQLGAEAGAFVIHSFNSSSWDQISNDYLVGLTLSYGRNSLSGIFRVFHYSSHMGDEFLINNDVERENFSYEGLGLIVSEDLKDWLRIYGGGQYWFSRSPEDLKPFSLQYGLELKSRTAYLSGIVRPVAAVDIKHIEDNDWSGNVSFQAGIRIENEQLINHNLRIMLGYYNGHSPFGQFHRKSIEYFSIGFNYNH